MNEPIKLVVSITFLESLSESDTTGNSFTDVLLIDVIVDVVVGKILCSLAKTGSGTEWTDGTGATFFTGTSGM